MSYPDTTLPEIPVPYFGGERYETEVPDTLDLAERAELTIHAMTRMLDPERDYLLCHAALFSRRPPVIARSTDVLSSQKHLESLPLLRIMSGSTFNIEVDKRFMESILHMTGTDGPIYIPGKKVMLNPEFPIESEEPMAYVLGEGRSILSLCMWYQHDGNPLWTTLVEKKIQRLRELATWEEDYAYFKRVSFIAEDSGPLSSTSPHIEGPPALGERGAFESPLSAHEVNCKLVSGLCVYYRLTGCEPALDLAGAIVRGALKHSRAFDDKGRWLMFHFHICTSSLLAIFEYAMVTKDAELVAFVDRCYQYGKALGEPLVGFFPELVPGFDRSALKPYQTYPDCETCDVADMIGLALKLTRAGAGDYWEDADRWVRNQFVENQLTWDKLRTLQDNIMGKGLFEEKPVEPWESDDIERSVGGFAAHAGVNDFGVMTPHAFGGVMIAHNCCTGNAGRTLYWIWDSTLTKEGDLVKVNLLLNRVSPWLDVESHLPYEGKVALKIKEAPEVEIRIPEWTQREEVTCVVNGKERGYAWRGNYIHVVGLKPGDTVTAQFPMRERTLFKVIGEIPYTLTVKGNTVVDMESNIRLSSGPEVEISKEFLHPRADSMLKEEYAPLYQRDHYKADKAPMKKRTRFVSREAIRW